MKTDFERTCAVLHDVVEDSEITFEDLRAEGFSEEVIEILTHLTKRDDENYDQFIDRVLLDQTACKIKIADLEDNMYRKRIPNPTPKDEARFEKYKRSMCRLSDTSGEKEQQ